ncbi:MAG: short-chain dehydrogenase/reductase SDR [Anaerolineaceae bacterium]|nr:MAG: short-chain dehydrogenase/reductase SDR [Anaerolineaceae bacterium]
MGMADCPLALVTGAAHRLGRAFALALARQGYAILLHYHSAAEKAASSAEEIRVFGVPVYPIQADLTDDTALSSLFSSLDSLPHKLRVLVNSAAVMPHRDLRATSAADWDAALDLNLRAPFLLAQQAAERMTAGGLIVNVTDVGAHKLWTGYAAYAVSKSALETLTRLMAKTYAPSIRVNAIAPGLVLPSENVTPEEWERLVGRLPLQRPASPEDVAAALEFLLKNESVTGQTITVDGGYSLL